MMRRHLSLDEIAKDRPGGGTRRRLALAVVLAWTGAAMPCAAMAAETYLTGFTKTANISNNLNRNYPNTGGTTAGSPTGVPNASFLYDPTPGQNGNLADVDVSYRLTADAAGRDYAELLATGPQTLTANVADATAIYFLVAAYNGQSINVSLAGTSGATRTFSNIFIPDFNGGGDRNTIDGDVSLETVFRVTSVGAGGTGNSETGAFNTYYLYQLGLRLGPSFAGQGLASATLSANGFNPLLLGATVLSPDAPASDVPEPATWGLMLAGFGLVGAASRTRRRAVRFMAA
jgi:hypothetical protein